MRFKQTANWISAPLVSIVVNVRLQTANDRFGRQPKYIYFRCCHRWPTADKRNAVFQLSLLSHCLSDVHQQLSELGEFDCITSTDHLRIEAVPHTSDRLRWASHGVACVRPATEPLASCARSTCVVNEMYINRSSLDVCSAVQTETKRWSERRAAA